MTPKMIAAHYNADNCEILGFYTEDIHGDLIPQPYIEISFTQWQEALECGFNAVSLDLHAYGHLYFKDFRDLSELREVKIQALDELCEKEIVSGFASLALGSEHIYPSKITDQLNLFAAKDLGTEVEFACSLNGEWEKRLHTAAQLNHAYMDGLTFKISVIKKKDELVALAKAAITLEELEAIVW